MYRDLSTKSSWYLRKTLYSKTQGGIVSLWNTGLLPVNTKSIDKDD